MLKLRIILLYDYLYISIVLLVLTFALISTNLIIRHSSYTGIEKELIGYIKRINFDGDKLTIHIHDRETVIGTYYFKQKKEKEIFASTYKLGDYIKLKGMMLKPKNNTIFNQFNYRQYLYNRKIFYLFQIESIIKIKDNNNWFYYLKQKIIDYIESITHTQNYIKTFIIGDISDIDDQTLTSYQLIGITHLFSISGMQISFLATILLFILQKLKVTETKRYLIVMIVLFFYMFLTNCASPVMRATIFFFLLSINKIYYFNIKSINLFYLTLSIVLLFNPYLIYDIGFQFSFIISYYLILYQPLINKYQSSIMKLFIISIISFMASLPIVIYHFYQINILSIFLNIFFVPLVTIILFPLALITLLLPFLDKLLLLLINMMEYIAVKMSNIEVGTIILSKPHMLLVGTYYLVISYCLYSMNRDKNYNVIYLVILISIHYYSSYFNNYASLTIIDVGQGDSILLRLPYNKGNILIDTGGRLIFPSEDWQKRKRSYSIANDSLIPYFKSLGIRQIDYLIITHGHVDHVGESINLINNFKINAVILNKVGHTSLETQLIDCLNKNKIKYRFCGNKDILNIKGYRLYFLNPNIDRKDPNENSLVIYTIINNKGILLTGDISSKIETNIINEYNFKPLYILKIAHHGSITSTSEIFLDKLKPQYALISVGLNNKFNHPSDIVLKRLTKRKIKTYLTSIEGSIYFKFYNNQVTIKTCPP